MADITYCANICCPFLNCDRHLENAPKNGPVSMAWLDKTCRQYLGWVADLLRAEPPADGGGEDG